MTAELQRCDWAVGEEYQRYHDEEWGRPLHGDVALFERLTLEAFQSGLSWLTILRKRDRFRQAFDGFAIETVAGYDEAAARRLLADPGIVRNRAKVAATIDNAKAAAALRADEGEGALDRLLWSFAPDPAGRPRPRRLEQVPAATAESTAMARELKRRGFRFVGPTTMYALMQAVGMVDDHLLSCHRAAAGAEGDSTPRNRG